MADSITSLSTTLKNLIRKYEHRSFLSHWSYLANMHYRNYSEGHSELLSPVRQLMYIISLYHSTEFGGIEYFEALGEEYEEIISLLNQIEKKYAIHPGDLTDEQWNPDIANKLFISNTTFLNYYLNAPLSYMEQDIERIRRTFIHFEPFIESECGLLIEDFLKFYTVICNLEIERYSAYHNHSDEDVDLIIKAQDRQEDLTEEEMLRIMDIADNGVKQLAIPIEDINIRTSLSTEKTNLLLSIFTLTRNENEEYLYYTDSCPYLNKPILLADPDHVVLIYSKQLINAIYDFIFELCSTIDETGRRVLDQRENYLEYKTTEVFKDFFGRKAKIYTNYSVTGPEKDLIVLTNNYAFIIECKANKYRIPFRDPIRAYDRIRDDFKKSIGKGYLQAKEVEEHFAGDKKFDIHNQKGQVVETIYPGRYHEVFTIIVTQERFGQIQCDLSYLLDIGDEDNYPWSVAIDDLETFLITLERKDNHIQEFVAYLTGREQLQGRLFCFDELELCSNFIMQRQTFLGYCNHTWPFISQTDINRFFDDLYSVGFGFKDELNIEEKPFRDVPIAFALIKTLKLRKPLRLRNL